MTVSTCSQCHRPLAPGDDICNCCGAFVSTPSPKPVAVATYPQGNVPVAVSSTPQPGGHALTACPACQAPVQPGDEFCERCGAVLASIPVTTAPATAAPAVTLTQPQLASQDVCPKCNAERRPDKKFCGQCGDHFPPGQGETLGSKYRLDKMIGSGGMGAVWLAEDIVLHRKVVIKALLNNDDPELVEQSVKEREFLARLNHGHIVSIYDCIAQGNQGFIVMEDIHGKK